MDSDSPGVTNVSILMEDEGLIERCATGNGMGQARDHTGIDTGGGGGMGVDNVCGDGWCGDDAIIDKDGVADDNDGDDDDEGVTKACEEAHLSLDLL